MSRNEVDDPVISGSALAIGIIGMLGASIYEIATAPSSARAYNARQQTRTQLGILPLVRGDGGGVALVGAF